MTKTFFQLKAELEARRCPTCDGLGKYDDLEPGDIMGNICICQYCKGTGLTPWTTRPDSND